MITVAIWKGANHQVREFPDDRPVMVSRLGSAEICLPDDYVSAPHAILRKEKGQVYLEAVGTNPTWLDDERVLDDTPVLVRPGSVITIRAFKITLLDARRSADTQSVAVLQRVAEIEIKLYEQTFQAIDFRNIALLPDHVTEEGCDTLRQSFDPAFKAAADGIYTDTLVCRELMSRLFQRLVLERIAAKEETPVSRILGTQGGGVALPLRVFVRDPEVSAVVNGLLEDIGPLAEQRMQKGERVGKAEVALDSWQTLTRSLEGSLSQSKSRDLIREELFRRILNLAFELGPLEDLLALPSATEILIVGHDRIFVEWNGRLRETPDRFPSQSAGRRVLERAVSRAGRRIDLSQPLVDVALPDGSRLNAVIPPLSRSGDILSIRRFRPIPYTLEDLERNGTYSRSVRKFLSALVVAKKNVVVSGGTGSGKTTLLGAMAGDVDPRERIILVEDTAEIRVPAGLHAVSLQSRHPNVEGKGEIPIRALVKNALRMRPDRLIVGECRGPEVIDMLQAMNTGHPGSLTTIHANSAAELPSRIETMALQGIDLPVAALRRQIAGSIDVVVHLAKVGGSRRVVEISEIVKYDERRESLDVVPIFQMEPLPEKNLLNFTGWLPTFVDELENMNLFSAEDFVV